jgi:hypothetical protein
MKIRGLLTFALVLTSWMAAPSARADAVMYDASGFIVGNQSFVKSFVTPSAGTLTVTLTNVAWPEQLANLNLLLSSTRGAMGAEMGTGVANFDVKAGEKVYAQWFGTAQGPLDAGVYAIDISFRPSGVSAVPLPTSVALLLSGLLLLFWHRRRDKTADASGSMTAC